MKCLTDKEYLRVYALVVPARGPCDTFEGEALRAASLLAENNADVWGLMDGSHPLYYTLTFLRKIATRVYPSRFSIARFRLLIDTIDEGMSQHKTDTAINDLVEYIVSEIVKIGVDVGMDRLTPNRVDSCRYAL